MNLLQLQQRSVCYYKQILEIQQFVYKTYYQAA